LSVPVLGAASAMDRERATMAETHWLYLERHGGQVRRVTLLDDELRVIATHVRDAEAGPFACDDCQLVRAVAFEEMAGLEAAS
jgi:hypothetical protein